jgi:hypothetical protein
MTENETVEQYKPKKVVQVGNSMALIVPPQWRKQFKEIGNVYGVWKVVRDKEGNQIRIEVSFQQGK